MEEARLLTTRFTPGVPLEVEGSKRKDWSVEQVRAVRDQRARRTSLRDKERHTTQGGRSLRGDSLTQGKEEVAHRHAVCHLRATASSNDRSAAFLLRG
ncbi:hypothetical protein WH47_09040 [Habropoda laboriosa]|uniref:Uncharacterized protein n=1 Tax=Habropoda laboriosa TaxID=597456 RepID=A0A0L7QLL1_9HYME|nr:hypothetical protein WH47_09040 [Habropoda laboriosa]